jgi:transmembrane sensor
MKETKIWDIIIRTLQGEADAAESGALQEWLQSSAANRRLFSDIKKIWVETEAIKVYTGKYDVDAAWEKINKRIHQYEQGGRVRPLNFNWKIAAAVAVLVVSGAISFWAYDRLKVHELTASTTASQMQEVHLADGSRVVLNKRSKLTYSDKFNGGKREVLLEGEAFFDIAKDSTKPFVIHTLHSDVQVLGTSFNVRAYKEEPVVVVDVVTGKVAFSDSKGKKKVYLLPGDKGTLNKTDDQVAVSETGDTNFNSWQSKRLVFANTRIDRVLGTLENYFEVEFRVSNSAIYNCYFTGTFDQPSINEVLQVLTLSMGISYTKKDNIYTLTGNGCAN